MLQYVAFLILAFLAVRIPSPVAYWFCDALGKLAFALLPRRRAAVIQNLSTVTGGSSGAVSRLARATFRQGARYYYDTFRVPALSDEELKRLVDMRGLDNLETALARGRGVVLFTAHFGSPVIVVQLIAMAGHKITAVAEPIKPQRLFDLVNGARGARGIRLVPLGPASFRHLSGRLARNEIAGIVADRDLQGSGISVMLFGAETKLPAGPVILALRTGAALMPAFSLRLQNDRFSGYVGEPLELERTGDLKKDIKINTQKVATVIEETIRRAPEQWVVFERIWPETQGPERAAG